MTMTCIQRLSSTQSITQRHINNTKTQSTQSEVEAHIYNLIQLGDIFNAKYQLQLINSTNGYEVISTTQFKRWHIEYLKNKNVNNEISNINYQKSINQNDPKGNTENQNFKKQYQKSYMKLISN